MRKMKALTVKMETVTLVGKVRWNLTCFVYYMYAIKSKIFCTKTFIFVGGSLTFG